MRILKLISTSAGSDSAYQLLYRKKKKKKPGFAARSFLILLNEYPSKGYSVMYMVNIQMNEKYFK